MVQRGSEGVSTSSYNQVWCELVGISDALLNQHITEARGWLSPKGYSYQHLGEMSEFIVTMVNIQSDSMLRVALPFGKLSFLFSGDCPNTGKICPSDLSYRSS